MKKLLALLLCLAMLATLAACGDSPSEEEVRGQQNTIETPDTTLNNDPVTNTPTQPTEAPSADKEFDLGQTSGLNYENKFIGIGCNLESNWTFYTDEQIRELNQQVTDLAGDEYKEMMKNAAVVYDMFAATADQSNNINVALEKSSAAAVAAMDLQATYQASQAAIKSTYENMGYTNIAFNITTAVLDGKSIPVMKFSATIYDIPFYGMSIVLKCASGYTASVSICTLQNDDTDTLLSKFYWIE